MNGESGGANLFSLFFGELRSQQSVIMHLHQDRSGHLFDEVASFLFFLSKKWVEKLRLPNVLAEFPMLKKHMHRLPESVIEDFDHLLVDEWILRDCLKRVCAIRTRQGKGH